MATVIADPASARRAILSNVTDFLYQLQDYELNAMGNSAYDLIIMDYAADGDDDTAFSRR
jgi:endo-alpha-1,4-polygalactosaminidase (GH114 family)